MSNRLVRASSGTPPPILLSQMSRKYIDGWLSYVNKHMQMLHFGMTLNKPYVSWICFRVLDLQTKYRYYSPNCFFPTCFFSFVIVCQHERRRGARNHIMFLLSAFKTLSRALRATIFYFHNDIASPHTFYALCALRVFSRFLALSTRNTRYLFFSRSMRAKITLSVLL